MRQPPPLLALRRSSEMRMFGPGLRTLLAIGLACCFVVLVACSAALPPPHVVDEAPQFSRVAELLKMPPLRPVPATMVELHPPYPCGKRPYLSLHFAEDAGLAIIGGVERYAVMDIATGVVVATGAASSGGLMSRNGRVLAIAVEGGVELRMTESDKVLVRLEGATPEEFYWVGDYGLLHVAAPAEGSGSARVVYLDLASGMESSLLAVPVPDERAGYPFGAMALSGEGRFAFEARGNMYELTLVRGAAGVAASVGKARDVDVNPAVRRLHVGNGFLKVEDEALVFQEVPSLSSRRTALPGFFPQYAYRTGDPDRVLLSGYFMDEARNPMKEDGKLAWRDFYYSLSRDRLAPVELDVDRARLSYVGSMRSHLTYDERTLRPYTLPVGGEDGEIAVVLAAAKISRAAGAATR